MPRQAHGRPVLAVVQGSRLVMVVSGDVTSKSAESEFMQDLLRSFAGGPVVIGPTTPSSSAAHFSASEAFAGIKAVAGWRELRVRCLQRNSFPNAHYSAIKLPSTLSRTISSLRWPKAARF